MKERMMESTESNQPTNQTVSPQKSPKSKKILLVLLALIFTVGVGAGTWWYGSSQAEKKSARHISNLQNQVDELRKTQVSSDEEKVEKDAEKDTVLQEDFFSITLPAGFAKKSGNREFQFTGEPAQHYTYVNHQTGEYFEVNVVGGDGGVNPDYAWTYVYDGNKIALQKATTEVCDINDEWCSSAGDGRLDVFIKNEGSVSIKGHNVYFTFGNVKTENPKNITFVDRFIDNLQFN